MTTGPLPKVVDGTNLIDCLLFINTWGAPGETEHALNQMRGAHLIDSTTGVRIVDVKLYGRHPCELAIYLKSPRLLLALLQYGSGLQRGDTFYEELMMTIFEKVLMCILNHELTEGDLITTHPQTRDWIQCACYVLRVCSRVSSYWYRVFNGISENPLLTTLSLSVAETPSLQHLCRIKIRKRLHDNWLLPVGIDALPISSGLKNYLNILEK